MTPAASIRTHLHGMPVLLEVDMAPGDAALYGRTPRYRDASDWAIREVWLLDQDDHPAYELTAAGLEAAEVPEFEAAVEEWLWDHENEEIAA